MCLDLSYSPQFLMRTPLLEEQVLQHKHARSQMDQYHPQVVAEQRCFADNGDVGTTIANRCESNEDAEQEPQTCVLVTKQHLGHNQKHQKHKHEERRKRTQPHAETLTYPDTATTHVHQSSNVHSDRAAKADVNNARGSEKS